MCGKEISLYTDKELLDPYTTFFKNILHKFPQPQCRIILWCVQTKSSERIKIRSVCPANDAVEVCGHTDVDEIDDYNFFFRIARECLVLQTLFKGTAKKKL